MIRVAGLLVELVGSHPVVELVVDEFRSALVDVEPRERAPDVVLEVVDGELTPLGSSVGSATVGPEGIVLDFARAGFQVEFSRSFLTGAPSTGSPDLRVAIGAKPIPFGLPRWTYRYVEPTFLDPQQVQGYLFVREVIEAIVALRGPAVPLHAAAVTNGEEALVLASGGGVGKTSTAMALLGTGRWQSLADDIAFVEPGLVHPNPRRAMVYRYNLSDPALRRRFLSRLSTSSRLHFRLEERLSPSRARRRIGAEQLWGVDVPEAGTRVGTAAALVRSNGPTQIRELVPAEMARRSVAISRNEFSSLFERLNEATAAGFPVDASALALERHLASLERAFEAAGECLEVAIGPDADPSQVAALLEGRISGRR